MPTNSDHLDDIISKHNRVANLQAVSSDIEKYSKRRSLTQIEVIDTFTSIYKVALNETAKHYVEYAQSNDINFQSDIITIPTGDGSITVFTFDGLHDIHLYFSKMLLNETYKIRDQNRCDFFLEQGWCNCHPHFNIRVGVSEGKGIIYRDVNESYNVAGGVINLASRMMGLIDGNQIAFSEDAYRQIIDMVDDPNFINHFREFEKVRIKHGKELNVFQFIDEDLPYLNSSLPEELIHRRRIQDAVDKMKMYGMPFPDFEDTNSERQIMVDFVEGFSKLMELITGPNNLVKRLDREEIIDPEELD